MTFDSTLSPVGWYYGSYLLRFVELDEPGNEDPERRFVCWENTVIVRAKTLAEAWQKVVKLARSECRPYRGGKEAARVQWKFVGIRHLVPIYEPLEDGAEIAWKPYAPRKLKTLRQMVQAAPPPQAPNPRR
jgi:hypothetical protein